MNAASGDLRPGDTVWLTPRTLVAPPVCLGEPAATVKALGPHPYMVVSVDGRDYRIHADNIRRSNPHQQRKTRTAASRPRPALPEGCEEVQLW